MPVYIITPFGLKLQCGAIAQSTMKTVKPLYPAKIGFDGHYVTDFQQPRLKRKSSHKEQQDLKNSKACRMLDFNDEPILTFEYLEEPGTAEIYC